MELGAELGWPGYRVRSVERWRGGEGASVGDSVAEEAPVALLYNGEPHVVMLATPLDLDDFALGFTLTELIVAHPGEVGRARGGYRSPGQDPGRALRSGSRSRAKSDRPHRVWTLWGQNLGPGGPKTGPSDL